jgi:hypothetical protein
VAPWALGISFWKPGFFLVWLFLASFKRCGSSKPGWPIALPCLMSLIVTLAPFFSLDVSIDQKLLAFDESSMSIHSILHSHTVKLPLANFKQAVGIHVLADSGDPWRMFVPSWAIWTYAVCMILGIISIAKLNLSLTTIKLGSFGVALSFFDGGLLAPYAVAGLVLIYFPSRITLLSLVLWPAGLYSDWFRQFLIFLFATQICSKKNVLLSLLLVVPLISNWLPWLLKPLTKIDSQAYAVKYEDGSFKVGTISRDTLFMFEQKPYPPAWNVIEVDGLTCDKSSDYSSSGLILYPRGLPQKSIDSDFGRLVVDQGRYNGQFKGCVPNSSERAVIYLLRKSGIEHGVLSN